MKFKIILIFVIAAFIGSNLFAKSKFTDIVENITVTGSKSIDSISLNYSAITLRVEQNVRLILSVFPEDIDNNDAQWTSSNETVAIISNGSLSALKEGTAVIIVTIAGKSAKCNVTVVSNIVTSEEGTITYPFGKYEGSLVNGIPEGQGTMYYTCRIQIAKHGRSALFAEKGDTFEGTWFNGDIVNGNLYDSNKKMKTAIIPGRTPNPRNLLDDSCED